MESVDSHLEMINYVREIISSWNHSLSRSLKMDANRLEKYTQRVWHWNVNTQESYKAWLVNSLKRKPRWGHHSSLETNQAKVGI